MFYPHKVQTTEETRPIASRTTLPASVIYFSWWWFLESREKTEIYISNNNWKHDETQFAKKESGEHLLDEMLNLAPLYSACFAFNVWLIKSWCLPKVDGARVKSWGPALIGRRARFTMSIRGLIVLIISFDCAMMDQRIYIASDYKCGQTKFDGTVVGRKKPLRCYHIDDRILYIAGKLVIDFKKWHSEYVCKTNSTIMIVAARLAEANDNLRF